jgi:hypothetical protein
VGGVRRKKDILEHLAKRGAGSPVSEAEFQALLAKFAPVTETTLRRILRQSGAPLAPLVEGIRQENFAELERTLFAVLREYEAAGDRPRRMLCRRAVIRAKDHARLALKRLAGERRAAKEEMILWMLEWLENPGLFPQWLELRQFPVLERHDFVVPERDAS